MILIYQPHIHVNKVSKGDTTHRRKRKEKSRTSYKGFGLKPVKQHSRKSQHMNIIELSKQ